MVKDDIKKANPKEEEPMKIYDKYMYKSQEKIKNIVLIIAFILLTLPVISLFSSFCS